LPVELILSPASASNRWKLSACAIEFLFIHRHVAFNIISKPVNDPTCLADSPQLVFFDTSLWEVVTERGFGAQGLGLGGLASLGRIFEIGRRFSSEPYDLFFMLDLSNELRHGFHDGKIICGVDEVGRGPLAGPVVAAAVILPRDLPAEILGQLRDSKKLSAERRDGLFEPILRLCRTCVAEASVEEIDKINILQASLLAMRRAVEGLNVAIDMALIDGNRCPKLACPAEAIVKGDDKSPSIAAASIIAKVTRDRLMAALAAQHPGYGWERNAGYGTPEHLHALQTIGVTSWHRTSFAPVREAVARVA
jgi:ribonuclease HII